MHSELQTKKKGEIKLTKFASFDCCRVKYLLNKLKVL